MMRVLHKFISACLFNLTFSLHFRFENQAHRGYSLTVDNCLEFTADSTTECAMQCVRKQVCLIYSYDMSCKVCSHSCTVLWKRVLVSDDGIIYSRKSVNLAQGKDVNMSSVFQGNIKDHGPEYAVDGIVDHEMWGIKTASSKTETSPWIQVDLQQMSRVDFIMVFNRWDTPFGNRLRDVNVLVDDTVSLCDGFDGPGIEEQVVYLSCQRGTVGHHVRLLINTSPNNGDLLSVSELEIRHFVE